MGFNLWSPKSASATLAQFFSLGVSRLARSCSDWYRLIEICALSETLVVDEEGVYDPNQYNDRLAPGLQGHHEAKPNCIGSTAACKAESWRKLSKVLCASALPTGFIYNSLGQLNPGPGMSRSSRSSVSFSICSTNSARPWPSSSISIPTACSSPPFLGRCSKRRVALATFTAWPHSGSLA